MVDVPTDRAATLGVEVFNSVSVVVHENLTVSALNDDVDVEGVVEGVGAGVEAGVDVGVGAGVDVEVVGAAVVGPSLRATVQLYATPIPAPTCGPSVNSKEIRPLEWKTRLDLRRK